MNRTLKIFVALLLIFMLHRIEAWAPLSEQYNGHQNFNWREGLTGFLSDFWMAAFLSLPFWVFEYFTGKRIRSLQKFLGTVWIILFGIFTASHQGYVEYFKFQIIPFHLGYLTDQSFVAANGSSMFNATSAFILVLTLLMAYWARKAHSQYSKKMITGTLAAIILSATIAHMFNIRWRINWFVIEPLQANYIEALYSNIGKKPSIKPVTQDELTKFKRISGQQNPLTPDSLLTKQNRYIKEIQNEVRSIKNSGKPVILAVILAESLRDTDTGKRAGDGISLTTSLDGLQEAGVRFTKMYSSGPVTRGGQEAIWCGTPSATDTSLMRSFPDVNLKCVPTIYRSSKTIVTTWVHGGDERFDSQLSFWKHEGVRRFVTKKDFPESSPSTGWGVSDLALFDKATTELEDLSKTPGIAGILPMILTVSNHIPWTVPDDASIETKNFLAPHAAHKTIRYFDESLDLFVGNLKEKNLWDQSLIIISGDHGNLELPWRDEYVDDPLRWERMLSHVSFTLTGGIIEKLRRESRLPQSVSEYSAQDQVAPFLSLLASTAEGRQEEIQEERSNNFMDVPLFEKSPWPVVSDLNQYLFLPENGVKLPKEKVLTGNISDDSTQSWTAATRYRAWLEFLYSRTPKS